MMKNIRFLLVGTVSNVETKISGDLRKILNSLKKIGSVDTFLVESDSNDRTINVLNELKIAYKSFEYESMGNLRQKIPNRIERIRFCRNRYVEYIRKNYKSKSWEFIVVADLDGMNSAINSRKIEGSIKNSLKWDACFSNQTFGYYDLYALRCKGWLELDCYEILAHLKEANPYLKKWKSTFVEFLSSFMHFDKLRVRAIYSNMRILRGNFIQVESAFGGFAIYKPEVFLNFDYTLINKSAKGHCEHLDLHARCIGVGLNLMIDPKLTNCHWNEYNVNKFKIVRFMKEFKKYLINSNKITI